MNAVATFPCGHERAGYNILERVVKDLGRDPRLTVRCRECWMEKKAHRVRWRWNKTGISQPLVTAMRALEYAHERGRPMDATERAALIALLDTAEEMLRK